MKPQTAAVLALLRQHPEGVTSLDALRAGCGSRLAARIAELRAEGFDIPSWPVWVATSTGQARVSLYQLREPLAAAPITGVQQGFDGWAENEKAGVFGK